MSTIFGISHDPSFGTINYDQSKNCHVFAASKEPVRDLINASQTEINNFPIEKKIIVYRLTRVLDRLFAIKASKSYQETFSNAARDCFVPRETAQSLIDRIDAIIQSTLPKDRALPQSVLTQATNGAIAAAGATKFVLKGVLHGIGHRLAALVAGPAIQLPVPVTASAQEQPKPVTAPVAELEPYMPTELALYKPDEP